MSEIRGFGGGPGEAGDGFDREIDHALASYLAGEPEPGMEDRVVAAARAEGRSRDRFFAGMRAGALAAAAGLAALAIATMWMRSEHLQVAIVRQPVVRSGNNVSEPARAENRGAAKMNRSAVAVKSGRDSRLDERETSARGSRTGRSGPGSNGSGSSGTGAQRTADVEMAQEGVQPIVMKPIALTPIRIGGASGE
jgi:uncharacterized membrane protein YgcG